MDASWTLDPTHQKNLQKMYRVVRRDIELHRNRLHLYACPYLISLLLRRKVQLKNSNSYIQILLNNLQGWYIHVSGLLLFWMKFKAICYSTCTTSLRLTITALTTLRSSTWQKPIQLHANSSSAINITTITDVSYTYLRWEMKWKCKKISKL